MGYHQELQARHDLEQQVRAVADLLGQAAQGAIAAERMAEGRNPAVEQALNAARKALHQARRHVDDAVYDAAQREGRM